MEDAVLDNPIESMIAICRATGRNVKRWQNGDMCLRWTAAGMLEAKLLVHAKALQRDSLGQAFA